MVAISVRLRPVVSLAIRSPSAWLAAAGAARGAEGAFTLSASNRPRSSHRSDWPAPATRSVGVTLNIEPIISAPSKRGISRLPPLTPLATALPGREVDGRPPAGLPSRLRRCSTAAPVRHQKRELGRKRGSATRLGSHLTDIQHPWKRVRARADLDDIRLHDLRNTFASGGLLVGEGPAMIGKFLEHT